MRAAQSPTSVRGCDDCRVIGPLLAEAFATGSWLCECGARWTAGDIGTERREVTFEPLPEQAPVEAPAPSPAPAPAKEPVPA